MKRFILFTFVFALAVMLTLTARAAPPVTISNSFSLVEDFETLSDGKLDAGTFIYETNRHTGV